MADAQTIERFFVCIGAQKAGTTWLGRVLARHPDMFFTPVKEIHYFDHVAGLSGHLSDRKRRARRRKHYQRLLTQWHRWSELAPQSAWYRSYMADPIDDAWYASLFAERGGRRFAGEATPEYAILDEAWLGHLKRLAPDARVLYVMRNPVDRTWSQVLHHCRATGRDAAALPGDEAAALIDSAPFEAHGDYGAVLDRLDAVFAKDQTLVLFYEEIHADRMAALQRICGFIGLDFDADAFAGLERRYNPSQEAALPDAVRRHVVAKYADMVGEIARRAGPLPEHWLQDFSPETPGRS